MSSIGGYDTTETDIIATEKRSVATPIGREHFFGTRCSPGTSPERAPIHGILESVHTPFPDITADAVKAPRICLEGGDRRRPRERIVKARNYTPSFRCVYP